MVNVNNSVRKLRTKICFSAGCIGLKIQVGPQGLSKDLETGSPKLANALLTKTMLVPVLFFLLDHCCVLNRKT